MWPQYNWVHATNNIGQHLSSILTFYAHLVSLPNVLNQLKCRNTKCQSFTQPIDSFFSSFAIWAFPKVFLSLSSIDSLHISYARFSVLSNTILQHDIITNNSSVYLKFGFPSLNKTIPIHFQIKDATTQFMRSINTIRSHL